MNNPPVLNFGNLEDQHIPAPNFADLAPSANLNTDFLNGVNLAASHNVAPVDRVANTAPSVFGIDAAPKPDFSAVRDAARNVAPSLPTVNAEEASDFKVEGIAQVVEAEQEKQFMEVAAKAAETAINSWTGTTKAERQAAIANSIAVADAVRRDEINRRIDEEFAKLNNETTEELKAKAKAYKKSDLGLAA